MSKNKTEIKAEPGKQEVVIIREFDAPRELVFKAFTDPELYVQWLGPKGYEMKLERFEPKEGGSYRYVHTDPDGNHYAFHGVYHEVKDQERIISTFEFEGLPDDMKAVTLETVLFETLPGNRTRLVSNSVFQSVESRDGMVSGGMEKGVNEGYERLDDLITTLL
jgi:uncharacterized protein YndB with AHSA1/START domain